MDVFAIDTALEELGEDASHAQYDQASTVKVDIFHRSDKAVSDAREKAANSVDTQSTLDVTPLDAEQLENIPEGVHFYAMMCLDIDATEGQRNALISEVASYPDLVSQIDTIYRTGVIAVQTMQDGQSLCEIGDSEQSVNLNVSCETPELANPTITSALR